jgi:hypothetical protein
MLNVSVYPHPAADWEQIKGNLGHGMIPWWVPLAFLGSFVSVLVAFVLLAPATLHPDEDSSEFWSEEAPLPGEKPLDI